MIFKNEGYAGPTYSSITVDKNEGHDVHTAVMYMKGVSGSSLMLKHKQAVALRDLLTANIEAHDAQHTITKNGKRKTAAVKKPKAKVKKAAKKSPK